MDVCTGVHVALRTQTSRPSNQRYREHSEQRGHEHATCGDQRVQTHRAEGANEGERMGSRCPCLSPPRSHPIYTFLRVQASAAARCDHGPTQLSKRADARPRCRHSSPPSDRALIRHPSPSERNCGRDPELPRSLANGGRPGRNDCGRCFGDTLRLPLSGLSPTSDALRRRVRECRRPRRLRRLQELDAAVLDGTAGSRREAATRCVPRGVVLRIDARTAPTTVCGKTFSALPPTRELLRSQACAPSIVPQGACYGLRP